MFSGTAISAELLQAYRDTDYGVETAEAFTLRIGQASPALTKLYKQYDCDCAAYITACNPHSIPLSDDRNAERQAELAASLDRRGLRYLPANTSSSTGDCPGEPSFLVLGLPLAESMSLAQYHEQNAIVWCGSDAVAQLILLR